MRLGQPAPTLSGGEAQRVKLAAELQKRSTGRTIYILDEPTTGLHFDDIRKLLKVINGLVDKGNTVIVIEHNLDVIKTSDWIVDMGPEGGAEGGTVVAQGTPEDVAAVPESYTGKFLAEVIGRGGAAAGARAGRAGAAKPPPESILLRPHGLADLGQPPCGAFPLVVLLGDRSAFGRFRVEVGGALRRRVARLDLVPDGIEGGHAGVVVAGVGRRS